MENWSKEKYEKFITIQNMKITLIPKSKLSSIGEVSYIIGANS